MIISAVNASITIKTSFKEIEGKNDFRAKIENFAFYRLNTHLQQK